MACCCLTIGAGPLVVVDTICSISLNKMCFLGWDSMQDLLEFLRYYFFGLCPTWMILFIDFLGFDKLDVVGLFMLLKCWVFVFEKFFEFDFSFFIKELTVSVLVLPSVFNLRFWGYYWSGNVSKTWDFFLGFAFLLDFPFFTSSVFMMTS